MYKKTGFVKGVFKVQLADDNGNEIILSVHAPKMRTIQEFQQINENDAKIDEIAECISHILSHNKENKKISADDVLDFFDMEEMTEFFGDFVEWCDQIKKK